MRTNPNPITIPPIQSQSQTPTFCIAGIADALRPFDPALAVARFAEAGFTERRPDGLFRNAAGDRLSFTITTGYKRLADALTIIQQEARQAGVEYRHEILDATAA